MGAGDDLAGTDLAGQDDFISLAGGRLVPVWNAILLDAGTRDFPQDANGFYIPLHPVDARVELAMIVAAGSVKSVPTLGNAIASFRYLTPQITALVTNEVRRVLKAETDAKNINILSITVEVQRATALAVELRYVNLRLAPRDRVARLLSVTIFNG